jgi:glutathione S-transferase
MSNELRHAPFWLVWNPNGRSPTFRHPSEQNAVTEAERLARLNPGETFIVLESVSARRVDSMIRIDMRAGDGIPF